MAHHLGVVPLALEMEQVTTAIMTGDLPLVLSILISRLMPIPPNLEIVVGTVVYPQVLDGKIMEVGVVQ